MTAEHLPPKNLYTVSERSTWPMHTVDACFECNNGGSVDDEQLKLHVGLTTGQNRQSEAEILDHLASTLAHNRRLANTVFAGRRGYTATGPQVAVEFDRAGYERSVCRMVRGLYFVEHSRALGLDAWVTVWEPTHTGLNVDSSLTTLPRKSLNGGTFTYAHQLFDDGGSVWHISIFGQHDVIAWAGPPTASAALQS